LASGLINLAQTRSFNISINQITATSDLNSIGYSFVVPVTSNTPGVEYYETQNGFQQYIRIDAPTRQLDIVVYDDNHEILPLYSNWYMMLQPMDD
jgi:flagellar hook assembly protein FlgD